MDGQYTLRIHRFGRSVRRTSRRATGAKLSLLEDLLWTCCIIAVQQNPQQIYNKSTVCNKLQHLDMSTCCTTNRRLQVYNKSATNRTAVQQLRTTHRQQIHNKSNKWSLAFTGLTCKIAVEMVFVCVYVSRRLIVL